MTSTRVLGLFAGLTFAPLASGPAIGNPEPLAAFADLPKTLTNNLVGRPKEQYISQLLSQIRSHGRKGQFIDETVVAEQISANVSRARSKLLNQILMRDANGDAVVSRMEIEAALRRDFSRSHVHRRAEQIEQDIRQRLEREIAADADEDGTITLDEAFAFADSKARQAAEARSNPLSELLSLDPDGDGRLTAEELEAVGLRIFARLDANSDDYVDRDEGKVLQNAKKVAAINAETLATCNPPPLEADQILLLVSGNKGDMISPVSLSNPNRITYAAQLTIEPGEKPLYIYATSSQPTIWQVTGAKERVAHMVLVPPRSDDGLGVVGLEAKQVTSLPSGSCFRPFARNGSSDEIRASSILRNVLGQPPAAIAARPTMSEFALPSAKHTNRKDVPDLPSLVVESPDKRVIYPSDGGPKRIEKRVFEASDGTVDPDTLFEFRRRAPGGIATFGLEDIVSTAKIEPYDVLPGLAGIIQLMKEGKLTRLTDGAYYIRKPIRRFPAGLTGAHSVKFVLGEGIPVPDGNAGHSCVISEETGLPVQKYARLCR